MADPGVRRAVVVGGSGDLGSAVARDLLADGHRVAVLGRDHERLRRAVSGTPALVVTADLLDEQATGAAFEQVAEAFGGLDLAVNALGVFPAPTPAGDLDSDVLAATLTTNVVGLHRALRHEIALMRSSGSGGAIVNVASNLGAAGTRRGLAAYVTSKSAVVGLTRTAALDHVDEGIRVNAVSPGAFDSAMSFRPGEDRAARDARVASVNPSGRVASVDEVVAAVRFLLSPTASYVVGHDLVVDGGLTVS